jgi:general secretion pathway protein B
MSYILDALQRADAERQRGHPPGLHTRTAPEPDTPAAGVGGFAQRGGLIALGVLIALGAVLWWWLRAAPPDAPAAPAAQAPVAVTSPATATAPPQPTEPRDNLGSETAPPVQPILAPPPPRPPARAAAPAPAEPAANAQRAPDNAGAAQASTHAFAPPATPAAASVVSFAELSPDARARLPAVNLSGSTYSKNPALRMLIVNGKVVQEGGEIAPGLTLETIAPRSAVLNHQGLRYRIGY